MNILILRLNVLRLLSILNVLRLFNIFILRLRRLLINNLLWSRLILLSRSIIDWSWLLNILNRLRLLINRLLRNPVNWLLRD